jgi:hypothetical protein
MNNVHHHLLIDGNRDDFLRWIEEFSNPSRPQPAWVQLRIRSAHSRLLIEVIPPNRAHIKTYDLTGLRDTP